MVPECQHILYSGKRCGRIPATGQRFCPAHRSRRRRDDDTFDREMEIYSGVLSMMDLPTVLAELETALVDVRPRIPRSGRVEFYRLASAVGFAMQRVREARSMSGNQHEPRQAPNSDDQQQTAQLLKEILEICSGSNRCA